MRVLSARLVRRPALLRLPALLNLALLGLALALAPACDLHDDDHDRTPLTPAATPTPTPKPDDIQFLVIGNVASAAVRYSNTSDGLTQVATGLPYFVSIASSRDSIFLSVEVTTLVPANNPTLAGFLQAQIFVNGVLFREGSAVGLLPTVSVSGIYRRTGSTTGGRR